jgi:excisionase family DNA binding protein
MEELLTVAEVASILKLNQQTIRNWIDAGTLPAVRIGRSVRIKRSDFDRFLEHGYRAGTKTREETRDAPDAESGELRQHLDAMIEAFVHIDYRTFRAERDQLLEGINRLTEHADRDSRPPG